MRDRLGCLTASRATPVIRDEEAARSNPAARSNSQAGPSTVGQDLAGLPPSRHRLAE